MTEISGGGGQPSPGGDKYVTWDAAYVLGSLSVVERREFEGHLRTCLTCHRAVGELAGMPALLGQLKGDDIESIYEPGSLDDGEPPLRPEVLGSLLTTVRQRRRRARLLTWAGGCAAAAAVAIGLFVAVRPSQVTPAPMPQANATVSMTPVKTSSLTATVSLVSHSWGTGIDMNCTYGPEPVESEHDDVGDKLAMVAVGRDGSHAQLATWVARTGVIASPAGSTSLPIDQIASVQVVSADTGDVLLQGNP
jgi:hypothetical protein